MKDDFDVIDLDETGNWSKLEIDEHLTKEINKAASDSIYMEEIGYVDQADDVQREMLFEAEEPVPYGVEEESVSYGVDAEQIARHGVKKKSSVSHNEKRTSSTHHKASGSHKASARHRTSDSHKSSTPHKSSKNMVVKNESIKKKKRKKKGKSDDTVFARIGDYLSDLSGMDKLVAGTGVLVLIVAIATVGFYSSAKAAEKQVEAMAPIGEELQQIGIVGQDTLLALSAGHDIEEEFSEEMFEETYEENEEAESGEISVSMLLTSVQKDLKIKFINQKSKKLVSNIPFVVNIKDADGKSYTKEDDDKDGIIYLKSMTPGKVTVSMETLSEEYQVSFDTSKQTITVKEKIDYKKIDVSDEVKKESQVNAKVEDTAAGNVVEAVLKDTVTWVESTKTPISTTDGYEAVNKSEITDPSKSAHAPFVRMTAGNTPSPTPDENPSSSSGTSGDPSSGSGTSGDSSSGSGTSGNQTTPSPSPTEQVTPSLSPTVQATPSPSPTVQVTPSPSPTVQVTPSPTVQVTPTPTKVPASANTTSLLKDKKGNQIFIKNSDGKYVEAKYADYYTNVTLYRKVTTVSQYKYTGWQELDGKSYFFDANGNKVTGEQVIQGAKYTFASDGSLVAGSGTLGIDVSKWNGNINWTAVKNSGVSYVIIRCGYRGSTTGALIEDPKFKSNIQGATKAGLKVGIYFFTQAVNEVEAVEEASMTIGLIRNYKISYPVFLDVESSGGRADGLDSGTRTNVIKAYCETIRNSGYTAGVYANKTWLNQKMNAGALNSYKIWLAQYNTAPTYAGKIDLWQYTSKGSVNGISGNTDMNLSYLGY